MSFPFALAYRYAYQIPQKEAKEKLEVLKKYLLPFDKPIARKEFDEIFTSVFQIPQEKLSLLTHDEFLLFQMYLYNLLVFRAKGEEIPADYDKELEFLRHYEDLHKHFPRVEIDSYPEEVVKAFAREKGKEIAREVDEKILEKLKLCSSAPYILEDKHGYRIECYSSTQYEEKKRPALTLKRSKKDLRELYAKMKMKVAYMHISEIKSKNR